MTSAKTPTINKKLDFIEKFRCTDLITDWTDIAENQFFTKKVKKKTDINDNVRIKSPN